MTHLPPPDPSSARGGPTRVVWVLVATAMLAVLGLTLRPLATAWQCHQRLAQGERAEAHVTAKAESPTLILTLTSGSRAGETCRADTSVGHHERIALGASAPVVLDASASGVCELEATLANSANLLWAFGSVLVALLLGLVLAGLMIQRSLTERRAPTTRLDVSGEPPPCPRCRKPMSEGCLVPLAGIHWRELGEPIGLPNAFGGLPGTVGWGRRPLLHAARCEACGVATFAYAGSQPR